MTTPRKPKPKTDLKVVGPDMEQMERALTEFAEQQAPMVSRAGSARERQEARVKEIVADLEALKSRETLIDRTYESVKHGFALDRADMEAELDLYENGLNSLSQQVQKAAAE